VHREDRAGAIGDGRLGRGDVDAQRIGVDVNEDRRRVHRENRRRGGNEGQRRNEDLVALAHPARGERRFHRVGSVRERQAVMTVLERRELGGPAGGLLALGARPRT